MKKYLLLFSFYLIAVVCLGSDIYSFENDVVPDNFTVTNGTLQISTKNAKLGNSSLLWNCKPNSVLSINNPLNLSTAGQKDVGGMTLWIYNERPIKEALKIAFFDATDAEQCSLDFNLDFKGWRCIWVGFKRDMGLKGTPLLRSMKLIAPSSVNGNIYLDFLEYTNSISWEKMSDFQYSVNQYTGIVNFLNIRNVSQLYPVQPNDEQFEALSVISDRLDNWYLGTGQFSNNPIYKYRENALNGYITAARNRIGNLDLKEDSDGTIKGIGLYPVTYQGAKIDDINITTFRNISETYLIQLAYDYRKNKNQKSLDTALKIFDWYYDQGWADGSALGSLRFEMIRSSGFFHSAQLLKDQLGEGRFDRVMDAMNWYSMFGTACSKPNNLGEQADYIRTLALPKLFYAVNKKDLAERNSAMIAFQSHMINALGKSPGFLGTLKPDYSGYHHHGPYYSAYYPDALYTACFIYYLLHDTPYDLGDEVYDNLKQALLTFRFFCGKYNVPAGTTGRFPQQQAILQQLLPAFSYLALSNKTPDVDLVGAFKRLWDANDKTIQAYLQRARTDICFSTTLGEAEAMAHLSTLSTKEEPNPIGTKFMPYSGLFIARQSNWMFTTKGFSKYIWDYESSGSENIYGRYLSNGHLEYTDLQSNRSSYNPSNTNWDWNHIPGATFKYLSLVNLDFNKTGGKHRNYSDETFLGGISFDDNCGMFTSRIHDNAIDKSFYADKSVFVFDNLVYCLGSNINSKSTTTPVYTNLFQNELLDSDQEILVNGNIFTTDLSNLENVIVEDNLGNAYIVHQGAVSIKKNGACILAYIDHGKVIDNKKYAYSWLIQPSKEDLLMNKSSSAITVLSQNTTAHAIYHTTKNIMGVSIFDADKVLDIKKIHKVNKPLLAVTKETDNVLEIAFSDPDLNRPSAANSDNLAANDAAQEGKKTEVIIELNGVYEKLEGDNDIIVSVSDNITKLTHPEVYDGQTYRIKLKQNLSSINEIAYDKAFSISESENYFTIESNGNQDFDYSICDASGKILEVGVSSKGYLQISKLNLTKGLFIIKADNKEHKQTFKITNN